MIAYGPHDVPAVVPPDVGLVRVDLDWGAALGDPVFDVLSDDEREAAAGFLHHADAVRSAGTRAVLRHVLAADLGQPAASLRFVRSARGRPMLAAGGTAPPLDFNVAHSGDHALIAWSRLRRVGVDVEMLRPGWDWRPLSRMVLGEADARRIDAAGGAGEREALFYDVWVAKEALLKADGRGITDGLAAFSVLSGGIPQVSGEGAVAESLAGLAACWLRRIPGHAAGLAWGLAAGRLGPPAGRTEAPIVPAPST